MAKRTYLSYTGYSKLTSSFGRKVYYRRVHYINTGNVPSDGTPLLIVSDHQNSLNDALGVLLSISDRIVHFIVRADVFALGPFVDKFLRKSDFCRPSGSTGRESLR